MMAEPGFHFNDSAKAKPLSRRKFNAYAKKYGLPARAFRQISKGEANRDFHVQQRDPGDGMVGYGGFQFTPNAWGEGTAAKKKFDELGGVQGMRDIDNQFKMARFLYKSAGKTFKPWYGTQFLDARGKAQEGQLGKVTRGELSEVRAARHAKRGTLTAGTAPKLVMGGEKVDQRGAIIAALTSGEGGSLLKRWQGQVASGRFTTTSPTQVVKGKSPTFKPGQPGAQPSSGGPGKKARKAAREADRIDAAQVPYLWGGGHAGKQPRGSKVTPLDCSGAVSRVLGLDPRVAAQFKTWGKPGRGKRMTVWANNEHVLIEINGRFWGTSKSNPGGGAGWIPKSAISDSYLSRFTPRHD
jgi:hypothetical protein